MKQKLTQTKYVIFQLTLLIISLFILVTFLDNKHIQPSTNNNSTINTSSIDTSKQTKVLPQYIKKTKLTPQEETKLKKIYSDYYAFIMESSMEFNIPYTWIVAVIMVESGGKSDAKSSAGARGLMQLMPSTAKELGCTDIVDPFQNIFHGTKHLSMLLKKFDSIDLIFGAYNTGHNLPEKQILKISAPYRKKIKKYLTYIY